MHTYKTILTRDSEAETPIEAALHMHDYLLELQTMSVGDEARPVYRVEQFVDTGVPPKVCFVDSLTWRAYADEGCTVLLDEDMFDGRIYKTYHPTARMVSNIDIFDIDLREAIELLAASDIDCIYVLDSSALTYWAEVAELMDVLQDGTYIDGLGEYQRVAILAALTHVEGVGAEEVHFNLQ